MEKSEEKKKEAQRTREVKEARIQTFQKELDQARSTLETLQEGEESEHLSVCPRCDESLPDESEEAISSVEERVSKLEEQLEDLKEEKEEADNCLE